MRSTQRAFTAILGVSVMAMVASVLPPFSDLIVLAANNMWPYPGPDLQFDYFIGAFAGLACGALLLIAPIKESDRTTVIFCWAVKLAATLFLLLAYEYAYGMDIDGYFIFDEAPSLRPGATTFDGTWYVRTLAWYLFMVIGPSYHGGKVIFSFVGFVGTYLAYRGAVSFTRTEFPALFALMSLAPTSLFWASTLGKDPICLLGVGLYIYGTLNWLRTYRPIPIACVATGMAIAGTIRGYFLPIMGLPLVLAYLLQAKKPILRIFFLPLVIGGLIYSIHTFQSSIKVDSFETFFKFQSQVSSGWQGGSSFELPAIDTPLKLALVAPLAVFTALFRPMIFEAHNFFTLAAALDNTLLLVIFFYAFARSKFKEIFQPEIIWMIAYVIVWAAMYGLGTGNLGAISRFKIQALPVFIILLVYMARKRTPAIKT